MTTNAIVAVGKVDISGYPMVCSEEGSNLADIIKENLDGMSMGIFDLDVIKVPSGGSSVFEVPDLEAASGVVVKEVVEGVILHMLDMRSYWEKGLTDEDGSAGSPPDCFSYDNVVGYGLPGGSCANCEFGKFESGKNNSQACKHNKLIFIMTPESFLPMVIKAPPTSLSSVKDYTMLLIKKRLQRSGVVSKFSLLKVPAANGKPAYSKIIIKDGERINPAQKELVALAIDQTRKFVDVIVANIIAEKVATDPVTGQQVSEEVAATGSAIAGDGDGFDYFNTVDDEAPVAAESVETIEKAVIEPELTEEVIEDEVK